MTCGTSKLEGKESNALTSTGLVSGHAYTLLSVHEVVSKGE